MHPIRRLHSLPPRTNKFELMQPISLQPNCLLDLCPRTARSAPPSVPQMARCAPNPIASNQSDDNHHLIARRCPAIPLPPPWRGLNFLQIRVRRRPVIALCSDTSSPRVKMPPPFARPDPPNRCDSIYTPRRALARTSKNAASLERHRTNPEYHAYDHIPTLRPCSPDCSPRRENH